MSWLRPGGALHPATQAVLSRREWLVAAAGLVGIAACAGFGGSGQSRTNLKKLGYLAAGFRGGANTTAFEEGLRALGWVDGQNLSLEYRFGGGQYEQLPPLAAELVDLKVDVIVATALPAIRAAMAATRTTPIVMTSIGDPVRNGLVEQINQPTGNVTGVSILAPQLSGKRLEYLKAAVPSVSRVAVLYNPTVPDMLLGWEETELAAPGLGIELVPIQVRSEADFPAAFDTAQNRGAEAMVILSDDVTFLHRGDILQRAIAAGLPTMGPQRVFAVSGALLSYGPDYTELFRSAAVMADKLLRGTSVESIPIEKPRKFELVVNLKTAELLGVTLPRPILVNATEAIQ